MDNGLDNPLISIIMPAYNADKFIGDSIASVCRQTYLNWELIVIDDGSTDATALIVSAFQQRDHRICYFFQQNIGLGAARNTGITLAKGTWIAFLDSDDLWIEEKLQVQANMAKTQRADIFFSKGFYLNNSTNTLQPYDVPTGMFDNRQMYAMLMLHNCIPVLSVMVSKKLAEQLGPQGTHPFIRGCEDLDYWLRACKGGAHFYGIDECLFKYRLHDRNMSVNRLNMQRALAYVLTVNYERSMLLPAINESIKSFLAGIWLLLIKHYYSVEKQLRSAYVQLLLRLFIIMGAKFLLLYVMTKKLKPLVTDRA